MLASTRKGMEWLLHRPGPSKLEQASHVPVGAATWISRPVGARSRAMLLEPGFGIWDSQEQEHRPRAGSYGGRGAGFVG